MADISLYRKYRPRNFENLVGQDHIRSTLLNAINSGHLSHAYLFCGPRGTGKTTTARLVAKAINCINPEASGESCNKCEYCQLVNDRRLIDIIEIDAASNRGIDEIRDLREKIKFAPNQAPHKVYIIDEVHMLTTPAFNALLKTLEEPPAHAYFILATTESHKVPETIISRCQRFDFHRIERTTIVKRLQHIAKHEQVEAEDEALTLISETAEGGLRDAISTFEQIMSNGKLTLENVNQVLGLSGHAALEKLFQALEKADFKAGLAEIHNLHKEGHDLYQFNKAFLDHLRRKLLDSLGKKENMQRYLRWIGLFQEAAKELKNSLILQLPLEIAVIKGCMTPEEEAKSGWFGGILGGKKEEGTKEVPKETAKSSGDGLTPIPQEPASKEKAETPTKTEGPVAELSLDNVKDLFPRVLDAIKTPSVRQSFRTGLINRVEGNKIFIDFQSNFYLGNVKNTVSQVEIEDAFQSVFGSKVKMVPKLVSMEKIVDEAAEIFGGEVLD
ncbi:DNA polymerase III subunit gamma/tau [Candidatus Peregrinibacteria bacterium]|jgi:DNA polymerase III subunit gamma/tau|nr:DNA polymerase III subunit gamma/tau [Candidatus Peregrinibacteria bacterium]MBT7702989.1 DNA polymerase III subunit gamma/tau [Candidatus Peregrinibacteria bacterium]